mmetsp:Transcript_5810/g.9598  ORF Transcript_5810/g.9598 Transcript_5810/m.9598 type:complete len:188 (+) Transcript_5810:1232-1795(+)
MIWNQSVFTFFELRDIARLENCIFLQKQEWKELVAQHIKHLHVPFPVKLQGGCAQWILQKQIVLKNVELGPRLNIHAPSCNVRVLLQAVEVLREGEQSDADLFLVAQNTPHLRQVHLRHRGFCALPHLAHYWPLLSVLDVNLTGQPGPTPYWYWYWFSPLPQRCLGHKSRCRFKCRCSEYAPLRHHP